MKIVDVFNRKRKKDEVPLSLFSVNHSHKTSFQIGRATPVTCIKMMQGNRLKMSLDQLTRFASLNVPVMNNFEVSFGAYFCPFDALDNMFQSAYMQQAVIGNTYKQHIPNFRNFFDPATPDSLRKGIKKFKLSQNDSGNYFGSIFDHLGCFVGTSVDKMEFAHVPPREGVDYGDNPVTYNQLISYSAFSNLLSDSPSFDTESFASNYPGLTFSTPLEDIKVIWRLDAFLYYCWANNFDYSPIYLSAQANYSNYLTTFAFSADQVEVLKVIHNTFFGTNYTTSKTFKDVFGSLTIEDLYNYYQSYVSNYYTGTMYGEFQQSLIYWLVYNRIYGDYFLNENFTKRDDFHDMIAEQYLHLANGDLFSSLNSPNSLLSGGLPKLFDKPALAFFADYISKADLLPVLWEKNRFTAALDLVDVGSFNSSLDVSSAFSPNDTKIGATIRENFFNRMYQKFKDLIGRIGYDYRDNTGALYGHYIDDQTLHRSQLIAYNSFDVKIGDIAQTSQTTEDSRLGDFAGIGISRDQRGGIDWTAHQNGYVMVIMWIRPKNVTIVNSLDRELFKTDYFDYLLPQFGGVGYQDIYNKEVYPENMEIGDFRFAREERYMEYMLCNNLVTGTMRNVNSHWNADRFLVKRPILQVDQSPEFLYITEEDNINRIFGDYLTDPILACIYFSGNVTRQLPFTIKTDF